MSTKNFHFSRLANFAVPLTLAAITLGMPATAFANSSSSSSTYKEIDNAITKVEGISTSLNGIVGGMLTVTVSAAGGSAVFQLFRRMILSNL